MKIIETIAAQHDIQRLRAALVAKMEVYEAIFIMHADELDPAATASRLMRDIEISTDPEFRQKASERLNVFSGVGAEAMRSAAKRAIREGYKPVSAAAQALGITAVHAAWQLLELAQKNEASLFAVWGMAPQPTAISVAIKQVSNELETAVLAEKNVLPQSIVPNPRHHRMLNIIPEAPQMEEAPAQEEAA